MKVRLLFLVLCCTFISVCGNEAPIGLDTGLSKAEVLMVLIAADEFQMGSDTDKSDEQPVHTV